MRLCARERQCPTLFPTRQANICQSDETGAMRAVIAAKIEGLFRSSGIGFEPRIGTVPRVVAIRVWATEKATASWPGYWQRLRCSGVYRWKSRGLNSKRPATPPALSHDHYQEMIYPVARISTCSATKSTIVQQTTT